MSILRDRYTYAIFNDVYFAEAFCWLCRCNTGRTRCWNSRAPGSVKESSSSVTISPRQRGESSWRRPLNKIVSLGLTHVHPSLEISSHNPRNFAADTLYQSRKRRRMTKVRAVLAPFSLTIERAHRDNGWCSHVRHERLNLLHDPLRVLRGMDSRQVGLVSRHDQRSSFLGNCR